MHRIDRTTGALGVVALVLLAAAVGLVAPSATGPDVVAAQGSRPVPQQQPIQASGIVTYGQGTCFPDALLLDCDGNVTHQLKAAGGSASFAAYLNQWVELDGSELTCVAGDTYIDVLNIATAPNPCGGPPTATPQATATVPTPTATPVVPPGVTPTATPPTGGNLALGKAVFASSAPDPARPPEMAVDGNDATTWASIPDPQPVWDARHVQWIYIDLGADYSVANMRMLWSDSARPRYYGIHVWRESWRSWQWLARTEYGKVDDAVTFPAPVEGRYFMLWLEVPYQGGSHYELREWQIGGDTGAPIQSTNIAAGKASVAYSLEPGFEAGKATDADLNTEWRSSTGLPQWIYVDLVGTYEVERAILRWVAGMHATSYTVYAWDSANWQPVYSTTRGTGADETVTFRPFRTRYLLVYATAGPAANVGLRELEVYERRSSTAPLPRPFAAESGWRFGDGVARSVDAVDEETAPARFAEASRLGSQVVRPPVPTR